MGESQRFALLFAAGGLDRFGDCRQNQIDNLLEIRQAGESLHKGATDCLTDLEELLSAEQFAVPLAAIQLHVLDFCQDREEISSQSRA